MDSDLISLDSIELLEADDVVESTAAMPWAEPDGSRSLLPWAIGGTVLLLLWRFVGVRLFEDGAPNEDWISLLLGGVLPTVFILGYPIAVIRWSGGRMWPVGLTLPGFLIEGAIAVGVLAIVYAVNIAISFLYMALSGEQPGMPEQLEELAFSGNPWALVLMGAMACIWAPIAEELFFRRMVLRAFAARWPIAVSVVVQGFLFAVLHNYGNVHLAAIFVLGLALGGLYAWRKTIITPMLLHMLQNTGATVMMGAIMALTHFAPVLGVDGAKAEQGCQITMIAPQSAADEAGLQVGDVIVSADGMPTPDFSNLRMLLMLKQSGDTVKLQVLRDGEELSLSPVLKSREETLPFEPAADDGAGEE